MRKIAFTSVLTLTSLILLLVSNLACRGRADESGDLPLHTFVAAAEATPDWIHCDFRNPLDRATMPELWRTPMQPCGLGRGWTNPGVNGVVAMGRKPRFDINTESTDWSLLLMTVRAYKNEETDPGQTMSVSVNGADLGTVDVPDTWTTVQLPIPEAVLVQGVNRVTTTYGYRVSASRDGTSKDSRLFAIHLREAAFVKSPGGPLTQAKIKRLLNRVSKASAKKTATVGADSGRFEITRSGTLGLSMALAADARRIEVEVTTRSGRKDPPAVQMRVSSLSSETTIGPVLLESQGGDPKEPSVLGVDVGIVAGESVLVMIEATLNSKNQTVLVSPPRTSVAAPVETAELTPSDTADTQGALPDIVVITIDAARADRLSCYGYGRTTTPNIDRLAAESLVFRSAFALAPYTLCSVPTMVTGLSFLDHQVVAHGQRLSDQATTLAEHLKSVGYRTACISATPNNSRSLGTDQGYDEFVEMWRVVPRRGSINAFALSELAVKWLAAYEDDAPLHLQLHYVPPHAPYQPTPEFDQYTDPNYDGPYDGTHPTLSALDSGRWTARPRDLDHLNALYDGNLLLADAAVEQVLDALRKRPRWRDTIVLLTSDHGEAFLEHGRLGHNSTVYDEMLHVPFVLRVPDAARLGTEVDLERLATLADIVPTLLAFAGLEAEPQVAGIDLLEPKTTGASGFDRYFVARTATKPPVYAIRNLQWKLMLSGSGQGALFNLGSDPMERNDLFLRSRAPFAGLGMLLTERLARAPSYQALEKIDEVPVDNEEMLKALGYVH